jgi:hypothetical protein
VEENVIDIGKVVVESEEFLNEKSKYMNTV